MTGDGGGHGRPRWGSERITTTASGTYIPDVHGEPVAVLGVDDRNGDGESMTATATAT